MAPEQAEKKIMPTGLFRRVPYSLSVSGRSKKRFESRLEAASLDDPNQPPEGGTQNVFERFSERGQRC